MAVSNGDVLKVFLELVLGDGSIVQNVYHFDAQFDDDQTDGAVSAAVEGYLEDIMGELATYLSDDFTINPSYLHQVLFSPSTYEWVTDHLIDVFTPSFTHTNTDDPFPNQIAPVMIGSTYRPKTRGRKFIPGCVETMADGSYLVTSAVTALVGAVSYYISEVVVSGTNVLRPGVPRQGVDSFRPFLEGAANIILGTQRRRTPGVGS